MVSLTRKRRFLRSIFLVFVVIALSSTAQAQSTDASIIGPEITISALASDEWSPDIAYNSVHNEYLVVWENAWPGGHKDIYAQRLSGDGRLLSWFAVATNTNKQMNPSVAYDPIHDRYLVVFAYDYYGNDSDWDINGRFIPWDGPDPSLVDFGICTWGSNQRRPAVAFAYTEEEFLVTWTNTPAGQPTYISARRVFAGGGFPPGDGFTVSSGPENRDFQDVAYNLARNEYLVIWDVESAGDSLNIAGVRLNAMGQPLLGGDPYAIGEFTIAGWPDREERPAVAACFTADQYMVAWQSDVGTGGTDYAIYARYLDGEAHLGSVHLISNTPAPQLYVDISCDFLGKKYFLAWQDKYVGGEYGIWGRFALPNTTLGPEFEVVGPRHQADREFPAVAGGKAGFLAAWEHDRDGGTNKDLHGRLLAYLMYLPAIVK